MPAPAPRTPTGRRRRAAGAAAPAPRWRSILFVLRARRSGPSSRPAARSASAVRSGSMDVLATTVSDGVDRCEYADRPCCGATRRTTSRSRRSPNRRRARSATRRAKHRTAVEIVSQSHLERREDFRLETNYAGQTRRDPSSRPDSWATKPWLVFIGARNPEISVQRIALRSGTRRTTSSEPVPRTPPYEAVPGATTQFNLSQVKCRPRNEETPVCISVTSSFEYSEKLP